ncbi:MAG: hypothetical protein DRP27_08980 [Thermotogae bacterium]|nr:MAG: hypothetical protein DRP27_08980 [Thermotogota bacterium]
MPLAVKRKLNKRFNVIRFSNAVKKTFTFLNEKVVLLIFLLVGTLLAFLKINAWGFFIVFGVYVVMYFIERITKIWGRNTKLSKT